MPKKKFNWKSREIKHTIIDDSETKKLNVELDGKGHYDEANQLALPSKKRKTKVKKQNVETARILPKKQRKLLEKIVEKKNKKENRQSILEELQKYQISKEEQEKLVSLSSVQTKGLKRLFLEGKDVKKGPKRQKLETEEVCANDNTDIRIFNNPKKDNPVKKKYDPTHLGLSDNESSNNDSSEDEEEVEKRNGKDNVSNNDNKISSEIKDRVKVDEDVQIVSEVEQHEVITVKKERKPAIFVDVVRDSEIQEQRMKLPILSEEQRIMEVINSNSIVIIAGETGSGKTTQLPQFLYEAGYALERQIGVTEPRRIAAISMSERVGKEMNLTSREVSYLIRFQGNVTDDTKIKFMTDGVLLKEIQSDFLLNKYSVIILDEAHERSLYTDLLVGLLTWIIKLREKRNTPLKLIIMSATLQIQDFNNTRLFKTPPPVINVESRQFPVTIHFNRRTDDDYMKEAYRKTVKIHSTLPEGGILVFVTGQQEVYQLVVKLKKKFPFIQSNISKDEQGRGKKRRVNKQKNNKLVLPEINLDDYSLPRDAQVNSDEDASEVESEEDFMEDEEVCHDQPLWVLPLFSLLPAQKQNRIFQPVPTGCRLCVVSTNVAETSLTIPGIKYVVDTGKTKAKLYDKATGVSTFKVCWTSKSSANQRAGRAGRTGPGHCYRLYSSAVFNDTFVEFEEPEIRKAPLDDVVLRMRNMKITSVINFPFPTAPDLLQLKIAESRLKLLGLLDDQTSKITSLGKQVAKFPVAPRFGKMIALSFQQDIVAYTIILVSALSVPQLLLDGLRSNKGTSGQQSDADKWAVIRTKWAGSGNSYLLGDFMVLMAAVAVAEKAYAEGKLATFCLENGVREKALKEIRKLRLQITNQINLNIPEAELVVDPILPPPTDHQAKMLRQILFLSLGDQLAKKITPDEVPNGEKRNNYKYAYKVGSMEDVVFLNKDCVLKRILPDWVVYQELYEVNNKIFMRGVAAVDVEWLPLYFPKLCRIKIPEDAVFRDGKVLSFVDGTFGSQAWPLNGVKMEYPESEQAYRWFAKFLLEGEVVEKLKKFASKLLSSPSMMVKKYAKLQPRTNTITQALISKQVRRKDGLLEVWKETPGYLLNEFLQWVPEDLKAEVTSMWPPC